MELVWPYVLLLLPFILIIKPKQNLKTLNSVRFPNARIWTADQPAQPSLSKQLFLWLAWACLVTALARPISYDAPIPLKQSGRDLMLIIDLSGSMAERDMYINGRRESRMFAVKVAVMDFIQQRQGDRLGVVVFGDEAFVQAPISQDIKAIGELIIELEPKMAGEHTAIGDGIALTAKRLSQSDTAKSPSEQSEKVAILLTDGVENGGQITSTKALEIAQKVGLKIHTIGFGGNRFGGSFDERSLKNIAQATNGEYFKAGSISELQQVYTLLNEIEAVDKEQQFYRPKQEWYGYLLIVSFAFILLHSLISTLSLSLFHTRTSSNSTKEQP